MARRLHINWRDIENARSLTRADNFSLAVDSAMRAATPKRLSADSIDAFWQRWRSTRGSKTPI